MFIKYKDPGNNPDFSFLLYNLVIKNRADEKAGSRTVKKMV